MKIIYVNYGVKNFFTGFLLATVKSKDFPDSYWSIGLTSLAFGKDFPDSYWSIGLTSLAFIQWYQTVSYQGLYGHRINALCTQSPCHCGYY